MRMPKGNSARRNAEEFLLQSRLAQRGASQTGEGQLKTGMHTPAATLVVARPRLPAALAAVTTIPSVNHRGGVH